MATDQTLAQRFAATIGGIHRPNGAERKPELVGPQLPHKIIDCPLCNGTGDVYFLGKPYVDGRGGCVRCIGFGKIAVPVSVMA